MNIPYFKFSHVEMTGVRDWVGMTVMRSKGISIGPRAHYVAGGYGGFGNSMGPSSTSFCMTYPRGTSAAASNLKAGKTHLFLARARKSSGISWPGVGDGAKKLV